MARGKVAGEGPIIKEEKAGMIYWCACGLSTNQPYCDGSHKDTDMEPKVVMIKEDRRVAWCACKQSKDGAFCDGAHRYI